jgi:hypothetical protein
MEEKTEVGAEARSSDLTISPKGTYVFPIATDDNPGPLDPLYSYTRWIDETPIRGREFDSLPVWISGSDYGPVLRRFKVRNDIVLRLGSITSVFFSIFVVRLMTWGLELLYRRAFVVTALASAVLFDLSVVWRESMGKSFEKEYAVLVARYERVKPGWDLVSAWARHQNTYREWAHEARWLVFKDGYILGVESCCPKYASDITPAEARANDRMTRTINAMNSRGEMGGEADSRLLGPKFSREAMHRSMDLYLEETEGPRVDPDKEASAIVESAIAMMLARFIPEVVTPSKGKTPFSGFSLKQREARAKRIAVAIAAIRAKRDRKAEALRRLAFYVHEHGLDAANLPKTAVWDELWLTLDCVPEIWLDRLYLELAD